ncbi:hypothetical protein CPJCM30710_17730 [Clostridium polyendosporum]|uniref:histidine kinase n=1 Tax=Clostridium polyendosporum TaxID=69208 RepID=A0A919RZJ1_9CLOT|nr:PAS domain-containing protein [Clostridium polyendosporum]GIM29107.1 hypothetical protein CPJCM30710_17730 [Clostridium polyendosporum]
MKYTLNKKAQNPFLHSKNNIIVDVNSEFIKFIGCSRNELIGKSLTDISYILRINSQIYLEDVENDCRCYVFTKSYESREVTISCKTLECKNEKIYFFEEKPNSRIDNKFMGIEQLYANSKIGFAIHSVPDLILLKANQICLDFWDAPYNRKENSIGKKQKEIIPGFEGGKEQEIFLDVIKTGRPCHLPEHEYSNFKGGTRYWDWSVIPIFVDGKLKYIIDTATEVTERVLNRKLIKEQGKIIEQQKKQQLKAIIENMCDGLIILDKDYNYSLVNTSAKEFFYNPHSIKKIGDSLIHTKYYDSKGNLIAAEDLPSRRVLRGERIKECRVTCERPDGVYHYNVSGSPIYDESGEVEKAIICLRNVTEQVNNDELIRMQKEQLEAIIENMSDALYIINKDYNITYLNSAAREGMYGAGSIKIAYDTLKYNKYYDYEGNLLTFENLPVVRVLKGERIKEYILTCKRPDGIYHFNISGSPIHDENGEVAKAILCTRNITQQVNNDKLIRRQKEKLEAIIENMSDALLIFDKNGNYTTLNKAAKDTFFTEFAKLDKIGEGLKEAEYFDMDKQLIPCDNTPAHRVLRGEKLLGYRVATKTDDSVVYHDVNGTPIYDNEGRLMAGILCCRDVTEKIKHEEDLLLKTQYDFLNSMIDNLDLPVLRLSYPDSKVTNINQKSYDIFKKLKPEIKSMSYIIGQNYEDITNFDKAVIHKHIENVIKKKESSYLKYQRLIVSGEESFVNILYQPVFGVNGEIAEIVTIIIDVTQEVKANNHMEKILKTHEEFFANISHELKTPLNVIFSTTQLFNLYLKNNPLINNKNSITNYVNIMVQNCYRLLRLISNLVDLSKIQSGFLEFNLSNENIVNVIEEIVQSASEYVKSKGLSIIFDTDVEEKIIACDSNKIKRVILNLISNAIKFSEPGDEIYVNIADKDDAIEISVEDNGIGIDEKHLDTIFERFKQVDKSFTRNTEGSGIGLCLVKSIVELHGGKINVESKLGEGSKFKIDLPSRTIEKTKSTNKDVILNDDIEMINIEFSDIYW